jgi:hypothetical protein
LCAINKNRVTCYIPNSIYKKLQRIRYFRTKVPFYGQIIVGAFQGGTLDPNDEEIFFSFYERIMALSLKTEQGGFIVKERMP